MTPTLPFSSFLPNQASCDWFLKTRAKLLRLGRFDHFLESLRQSAAVRALFPSEQVLNAFLVAYKDVANEPRDARGRWTRGGTASTNARPPVPEKKPRDRAARALASYKPATKAKQDHAEGNEEKLARHIGGRGLPDNEPMDVLVPRPGGEHGIELKTMLDNARGAITVHGDARLRKHRWAEATGNRIHTVVMDDRDVWEDGAHVALFSGHKLYYRRGVGSFSVKAMYPVKSYAELKELLEMPDDQLPMLAQARKRGTMV